MTTLDRESIDTPARTAVLDSAHVGDIEGALGRIRLSDNDRPRTLKTRLAEIGRASCRERVCYAV